MRFDLVCVNCEYLADVASRSKLSPMSDSLGLSGNVGIKGHAVAEVVAPTGVARALLYIFGASGALPPSFFNGQIPG